MQNSATSGSLCAIAYSVTLIIIDQEHDFRVSAEVIRGSAFSSDGLEQCTSSQGVKMAIFGRC